MTKPITSVAAMMLYEQGALELTDPVARFIPSFADARVYNAGPALNPSTVPVTEPVRVWHLLTHTSGLTYGFHHAHPVDEMYRLSGFDFSVPPGVDLAAACDLLAELPLLFQPGTEWNYGVSTDVLGPRRRGRLGPALRDVPRRARSRPAGHGRDRRGRSREDDLDRLATLYMRGSDGGLVANAALGEEATRPPLLHAGGGGWCRRQGTTTASPRCCCAAVSSTASGCSARAPSPS